MKPPYWLTKEECLALHDLMLADFPMMAGNPKAASERMETSNCPG